MEKQGILGHNRPSGCFFLNLFIKNQKRSKAALPAIKTPFRIKDGRCRVQSVSCSPLSLTHTLPSLLHPDHIFPSNVTTSYTD